jgi:hypothetical protein
MIASISDIPQEEIPEEEENMEEEEPKERQFKRRCTSGRGLRDKM